MSRVSKVFPHLSKNDLKEKIKKASSFWIRQKWQVIYSCMVEPRTAKEIAQQIGISVPTVHKVISQYNRQGARAIETNGSGGRRNCYLSLKAEKEFLETFFARAARGQIPTIKEIKLSYEQKIGKKVHKTTIYRLLDRHKWRKIVPRSNHPKSKETEQLEFKKAHRLR
ncbi:MAG: winged helix-turn-helix domain-containing protein [Prochloraceae cyanobacterium]|nr:winged helix-turn-helix domain-containing protein [Prochloraceae cyanobacterium]